MSILTSASFYTARLRVTPTPATLSETFAILSELKQFGTVATFVHDEITQQSTTSSARQIETNGRLYSVVYTTLAPRSQAIQAELVKDPTKKSINFDVSTNAAYPNPRDLDPYNVRGLLQRKPRPKAQRFTCTLTFEEQSKTHPGKDVLGYTEHNGPFSVDRDDGFAWILAKSNTPTGMITGLLPPTDQSLDAVKRKGSKTLPEFTSVGQSCVQGLKSQAESKAPENSALATFSLSKMYRKAVGEEQPYAKRFRQLTISR